MAFFENGTLVTDKRTVAESETWDSQTDWEANAESSLVGIETGTVSLEDDTLEMGEFIDFSTFTPSPPHTIQLDRGQLSFSEVSTSYSSRDALEIDQNGARSDSASNFFGISRTIDVTDASTLHCVTEFTRDGDFDQLVLRFDNSSNELLFTNTSHSWTERTFDISSYSGSVDFQIGHSVSVGTIRTPTSRITDMHFEA